MESPGKNPYDLGFHRFIIDSLPVGIMTVDAGLKINSFNPWAEAVTGYSAKEVMRRYCGQVLKGGMCDVHCPLKTVIDRQHPVVRVETTIRKKNGQIIPVRMNTAALLDEAGTLIGGVEAFQDISYLKTLEEEKNNFISMIAHDMKSSVTVIGGFALRLLTRGDGLDREKHKEYLGIIRRESSKLESMIHDFLEFSRLQRGEFKLNFGPTSLDKELMELVESYQVKASQAGVGLEFQGQKALPMIEADAAQLRRVFTNLLDNAIKFSKGSGKITVIPEERGHEVLVRIADQGKGIAPAELPYIFYAFHHGKESGGFGLGLAAVKAIVEGHGGRLEVDSELDRGSTFTVILPKAQRSQAH